MSVSTDMDINEDYCACDEYYGRVKTVISATALERPDPVGRLDKVGFVSSVIGLLPKNNLIHNCRD